jgi:hypothetical protein
VINTGTGETCRYYENPLDWNQQGVTGPTGPTGTGGVTGLTVIHSTDSLVGAGWNYTLHCPGNKIAINGGAETFQTQMHLNGTMNAGARDNGVPNGTWEIDFHIDDDAVVNLVLVCVDPPVGNSAPVQNNGSVADA